MTEGNHITIGQIGPGDWKFYWNQVETTLGEVFEIADPHKNPKLTRLRERAEDPENPSFGVAVFHLDPFQVAADLAEIEHVTYDHRVKYQEIVRKIVPNSVLPS